MEKNRITMLKNTGVPRAKESLGQAIIQDGFKIQRTWVVYLLDNWEERPTMRFMKNPGGREEFELLSVSERLQK